MKIDLDTHLFSELDTYSAFKSKFDKDKKFRDAVRERFFWGNVGKDVPEFVRARYNWSKGDGLPESRGTILCSLVKNIENLCPGVQRHGNVLVVPQFGRIFLAEFLIKKHSRSLIMLRIELGSPVEGQILASGVEGNGVPWP